MSETEFSGYVRHKIELESEIKFGFVLRKEQPQFYNYNGVAFIESKSNAAAASTKFYKVYYENGSFCYHTDDYVTKWQFTSYVNKITHDELRLMVIS